MMGAGQGATAWTAAQVAMIARSPVPELPVLTATDAQPVLPGIDLWDMWPLAHRDGRTATIAGGELWFVLSAPAGDDPGHRHGIARIRALHRDAAGRWHDRGPVLPAMLSPGSREWAGSAVVDDDGARVTLFFTASGRAGEVQPTFEQRLFEATAAIDRDGILSDWTPPVESLVSDGDWYVVAAERDGEPGMIKAFRDPAWFRDPATGRDHLLFTGSLGRSADPYNGAVGWATHDGARWVLQPPLITADGVNNELERPHIVVRDGHYYLFWSTQTRTFAPGGPTGPNGLYGMVADRLTGPYRPLNGTGLVAANPAAEPLQCYSWWVLDTLEVASFVDHWGLAGRRFEDHPAMVRDQFGGVPAPRFRLHLDGDRATIG